MKWKQDTIFSLVVYVVRMLLGVSARGVLFSYVPEVCACNTEDGILATHVAPLLVIWLPSYFCERCSIIVYKGSAWLHAAGRI